MPVRRFLSLRTELSILLISLFAAYVLLASTAVVFSFNLLRTSELQGALKQVYSQWILTVSRAQSLMSSGKPLAVSLAAYTNQKNAITPLIENLDRDHDFLEPALDQELHAFLGGLKTGLDQLKQMDSWISDLMASETTGLEVRSMSLLQLRQSLPGQLDFLSYQQFLVFKLHEQLSGFDEYFGDIFEVMNSRLGKDMDQALRNHLDSYLWRGVILGAVVMILVLVFLLRILSINAVLDQGIRQRTDKLNQSLENLRTTQAALLESRRQAVTSSLIVGISHEMNTPLGVAVTSQSALGTWAKGIQNDADKGTLTRKAINDFLSNVMDSCRMTEISLGRLSDHITMFRRLAVDAEEYRKEDIRLGLLLEGTLQRYRNEATAKGMEIDWDIPEMDQVRSSPSGILHILCQLLDNAMVHGKPVPGQGRIHVSFSISGPGDLTMEVRDNGPGIPEKDLERVLEPFFTTARMSGHMGLGLNIIHNIVTQGLQGSMELANLYPGFRVTVKLP